MLMGDGRLILYDELYKSKPPFRFCTNALFALQQKAAEIFHAKMTAFIAYYRVSTKRQGASGLGLNAQWQAASPLVAEYTEIESGRKRTNRPQLLAALEECRKCHAGDCPPGPAGRNVAFIEVALNKQRHAKERRRYASTLDRQ